MNRHTKEVEQFPSPSLENEDENLVKENIPKKNSLSFNDIFEKILGTNKLRRWVILHLPGFLATIIYLITLKGCYGEYTECLEWYPIWILKLVLYVLFFSGFLFFLQFLLFFYKYTGKKPLLIFSIIIILMCFIYDTESNLKSHGAINRVFLLLSLFFFIVSFFLLEQCYRRVGCSWRNVMTIMTFFIIVNIIALISLGRSCEGWNEGLGGVKIENGPSHSCNLYTPKICASRMLDGFFDVTRLLGTTCHNQDSDSFENLLPHLKDKSARIVGFPRTASWDIYPRSHFEKFQDEVLNSLINMEDPKISNNLKKNIEVTANFTDIKNPKINIHLKRNEKLVKEKKKIFEKYKDEVGAKNILYIFIDSISRSSFKQKLPKTWEWMDRYYYRKNNKDANFETFQFMKFHGLGRYTGQNMVPTFFGTYNIYYSGKYFLKDYTKRGYITGQAVDFCNREVFEIENGAIEKMEWDRYDHELVSLFCDPNFTPYKENFRFLKGENSALLRCLYGKRLLEYSFDYGLQFFREYKDMPKFFRVIIQDSHESTAEVIKYNDDLIVNFLEQLRIEGFLDETILMLSTDHGQSFIGPYMIFNFQDWFNDLVLPTLFISLPQNMKNRESLRESVINNEQIIVTPYTIYNSLKYLMNDEEVYYSQFDPDNFFEDLNKNRACNVYYDRIYYSGGKEFLCRCYPYYPNIK
jgi:hypothetical protein